MASKHRAALLALALAASAAHAQSQTPWNGAYAGVLAGGAMSSACNSWIAAGATVDPASVTAFSNRNCPRGGWVGGLQIGDNFQTKRLVWGVAADLDAWSAKNSNPSFKYPGEVPPPGSYAFSGKLSPNDFMVIGPRIGYAGDLWLPYLRLGTIITGGSGDSTLSYTPTGTIKPTASFNGGKNFTSAGWVAGGGTEIGLNGAWSITAEYLHVDLGKSRNAAATCNGPASACAAFSSISLDSVHETFSANIFRIGINYWFGYWGP
jgi:outer membrane immunogenic protein